MAYTLSTEEFELLKSARLLGGAKKVKELLKVLEKHNIDVENLISYLRSIDYKVPNPLELRVAELEKRVSALESGKPLSPTQPTQAAQRIEITLSKGAAKHKLVPIPKKFRPLFPGYKVPFILKTSVGEIETHITGGHATDKRGDPSAGQYFTRGLSKWFEHNDVKEGDTVVIEIIEPYKRYELYKKTTATAT